MKVKKQIFFELTTNGIFIMPKDVDQSPQAPFPFQMHPGLPWVLGQAPEYSATLGPLDILDPIGWRGYPRHLKIQGSIRTLESVFSGWIIDQTVCGSSQQIHTIRSVHCGEWLSPLHGDPLSISGFFHRARNSLHPLFPLRQHPTENCILWGLSQHFGQSISHWAGPCLRRVSKWVRRHVISLVFLTSGFPEIFERVYFKMMILIIVKQFETWTNDSIMSFRCQEALLSLHVWGDPTDIHGCLAEGTTVRRD